MVTDRFFIGTKSSWHSKCGLQKTMFVARSCRGRFSAHTVLGFERKERSEGSDKVAFCCSMSAWVSFCIFSCRRTFDFVIKSFCSNTCICVPGMAIKTIFGTPMLKTTKEHLPKKICLKNWPTWSFASEKFSIV